MIVPLLEESILRRDDMVNMLLNYDCCWGGLEEARNYINVRNQRREKYDFLNDEKYLEVANLVNENGYAKIDNFINKERIFRVKKAFQKIRENNQLQYNDIYTEQVGHPLSTCDGVFDIAFDDELLKIATAYFGCLPTINNVQLRNSKATKLPEEQLPGNGQTTLFHCDKDSPRFLKFFFYLTDVNKDNGPFTYVHGSHVQKFSGWKNKYRWNEKEISSIYGADRIVRVEGKVGDLIIANTNGFHKGTKVEKGEREIMTVYCSIHPTQWQTKWGGRIRTSDFESLPDWKKPLADYLNKI